MTSRIPLPLRLVQSDLWSATASGRSSAGSRVLTAYKPSGLPCYATSQVSAVASSGGDGRRLCAIHTRHTSSASSSAIAVEAGPQPHPEDPSDSLLTRVVDAALPGCVPYVALPVVSSLLRRGGHDTVAAAQLNQWTSRHKGLVVVTGTPSDAVFLRNAAQLDLVQQTYRVVCRLPPGVGAAARRYLRAHHSCQQPRQGSDGASTAKGMLNPYVQAHMERRRQRQQLADLTIGIPLSAEFPPATAKATATAVSTLASDARLPASVRPHPLVDGGFFDVARGQLRVQGTVRCYIRARAPLTASSAARVHQRSRLHSLFSAPEAVTPGHGSGAFRPDEDLNESQHPWMRPGWRLGVSLDIPHMQCDVAAAGGDNVDRPRRTSVPAPRGKSLSMEFCLLSLSPRDDSDVALYEVHTHGDTTADEVAAVFHAEGLRVVNDYVQDVPLAVAVEEVAACMRAAPPGLLHELPLGLQHRLRSATAEELVALPLMRMPLEDADLLAAQHTLAHLSSLSPSLPFADDVERLRQVVMTAASSASGSPRHPLQRLLLNALSSLKLTNEAERRVYEQVLALTLGSGVECAGVVFPDPSDAGNVHVLQQLWLTYEQQRQRQPSLADAARAARQHPLASSLRYTTRSVLDDPAGLARVPLLQDVAMGFASDGAAESLSARDCNGSVPGGRGECSFTQAAELLSALSHSQNVEAGHRLSGDEACETAASALTRLNDAAPRWMQTEVPLPYVAAFQEWCAACLAPSCCTDTAAPDAGVAALLPWPESLLRRCNGPGTSKGCGSDRVAESHRSSDDGGHPAVPPRETLLEHVRLPVRVFLRVEELGELRCAYCGGVGHTWQHCVARVAEAVAVMEDGGLVAKSLPLPESTASTAVGLPVSQPAPAPLATSLMDSEGITSTDDAAAALAEQANALTRHRQYQQQHVGRIGYDGDASASPSASSAPFAVVAPLIAVPNVAATHRFKAGHALRSESRKPAVHRRVMRCVYCGGRHHVTACPALRAQDSESEARRADAAAVASPDSTSSTSSPHHSGPPLFCIKCGQTGHLYTRCREVPVGLHHATHCPICLQLRTSGSHDPAHCPRGVPVPDGYRLNGIPVAEEGSTQRKASNWQSSSQPQAHSEDGYRPATADRQSWRGSTHVGGVPRRGRRRASVLIADSFVDSK
ncbi:conserved hypothetical protein [Leishmania major strain Friedlin]|uniref:CCHC-type domain-containing protein n=1 Tax=Leishmania major TaxID=5664 RepID=Q4Q3S0_LEIMA|nr:conserved hypothetical protein [Leishmania major strain Friedlin]CAG9580920.1 hypothetical_protein_-_conserved [Leishmania major strain Friedlin]CAJ06737.1 conserved hypothetical protein [Leishmania major strain Friedlin]|eukprot:XP_001686028.1 conserved hypothetical protein [Leishmania major strain Friedlin]